MQNDDVSKIKFYVEYSMGLIVEGIEWEMCVG